MHESLAIHNPCGLPVELCECKDAPVKYDWERDVFVAPDGCACAGVEVGSHLAAVPVEIPDHMADYRKARVSDGLSPLICIDACALPEIRQLWSKGIRTYGSCCGHNQHPSMVNVHEEDSAKMDAMGYKQWPHDQGHTWKATYYLKSVGRAPHGDGEGA